MRILVWIPNSTRESGTRGRPGRGEGRGTGGGNRRGRQNPQDPAARERKGKVREVEGANPNPNHPPTRRDPPVPLLLHLQPSK